MSPAKDAEKSNIWYPVSEGDDVDKPMSASRMKELVCALVEEITTGARRDVHARLYAVYKMFARSTPVEGELTDNNKQDVFHQIRTRVQQTVSEIMESLSFGNTEAIAVAKLVAAGTASEKVGYLKSPAGFNMSSLLSSAKEALTDRNTEPNERAVTTNSRASTEFWSAEQPRRKSVQRRTATTFESPESDESSNDTDQDGVDRESFENEAKALAPEVWFDEDEITQKERRKSLETVSKFQVPGGQFTGSDDKRSIRKILRWIRQESEDKCLTPLESYFLVRTCFKDRLIKGLERAKMHSQKEVRKVLIKNFNQLLTMFAPTLQHERNRVRRGHMQFRPRFRETLQEAIVRYDELIEETEDFGIVLSEMDKISVFMDSLADDDRLLAVTVQENCKGQSFEQFKRRLVTYSQNKSSKQFQGNRRNDASSNQNEAQKGEVQKQENNKEPQKPQRQNDSNHRGGFQKRWQSKKNEANVVEGENEDEEERSEAENTSDSATDTELNLVELGIAPENHDYVRVPKISIKENATHYSRKNCVELNNMQLENSGARAGLLRVRINDKDLEVLVDSGATRSLVDVEFMKRISDGKVIPGAKLAEIAPLRITYADGREVKIKNAIELPLHVEYGGESHEVRVQFLLHQKLKRGILLGRDAMDIIGIHLVLEKPKRKSKKMCEGKKTREDTCMVSECSEDIAIVDRTGKYTDELDFSREALDDAERALVFNDTGQDEEHPIINQAATLLRSEETDFGKRNWKEIPDDEIKRHAIALLNRLTHAGWMGMAESYKIRIAELVNGDKKDTKDQKYRFEVTWAVNVENCEKRWPWNSQNSIDRLNEGQKEEWKKQLQGYVEQEWWLKDAQGEYETPAATVFPVLQCSEKTTTVRPCSDFRLLNSVSPRVSAVTLSTAQAVWKLRSQLKTGDSVHQLDLAKAFYRIHTVVKSDASRIPLVLRIGNEQFVSDRLVFGLSCGPQALICSQLIVRTLVQQIAADLFTPECRVVDPIVVMDDFLFTGAQERCEQTIRLYDTVWQLTGFDCPTNKRSMWNDSDPVRWLGQHYKWKSSEAILSMIRSAVVIHARKSWTKRQAFQTAGQITSNTNSFEEAMARAHADCARALSGKSREWDKKLPEDVAKALVYHLEEAGKCWERARETDAKIPLLGGINKCELYTDACATGMGMVIMAQGQVLFAEGRLFKESSKAWHVNRRELYALARSVMRTDSLISGLHLRHITAFTDSRVAKAQADPWRKVATKSMERQVLLRLKNCILEVSGFWRSRGAKFTVNYIQGETNIAADALSRVRSNGPSCTEEEINIVEVNKQIDDLRGFRCFKEFMIRRQILFGWKGEDDIESPTTCFRKFIISLQEQDSAFDAKKLDKRFFTVEEDGMVTRRSNDGAQIYIPDQIIVELLQHIHRQCGHAGLTGTLAHFARSCYHPKARRILKKVIGACDGCNRASNRTNGQTIYGKVQNPLYPFHTIGLDLYGPLQRGKGETAKKSKKTILTLTDRLTGWTHFQVLHNAKAGTVVKAFEDLLYIIGPNVKILYTDGGPQFAESSLFVAHCKIWGIQQRVLPPYTPHLGGFYEVKHKTATATLRAILAEKPLADWQTMANIAAARINSHVGADRTSSPHELVFGWKFTFPSLGVLFNALELEPTNPDDVLLEAAAEEEARSRNERRREMLAVWDKEYEERRRLAAERFTNELPKNRQELVEGDKVYLVRQMLTRKFEDRAIPYRLIEKMGDSIWKAQALDEERKTITVHARHLRKAEELPDSSTNREPSGEATEENREVTGVENGSGDLPVKRKTRTTPENDFLASIHGQISSKGRVRRGSMSKK